MASQVIEIIQTLARGQRLRGSVELKDSLIGWTAELQPVRGGLGILRVAFEDISLDDRVELTASEKDLDELLGLSGDPPG